jgi:NAD(P)-dependent dehydrogenase (short-subunit alcohol dehydrogenase family)
VVVLGASSGLGAALALVHAWRGDNIVVVARREHRLEQLRREAAVPARDERWITIGADLRDRTSVEALAEHLAKVAIGRLYLNAAASPPEPQGSILERIDMVENYHRLLFGSYIALTDCLVDEKVLGPHSTVVAVSSLAAALPFPGLELYCAGKSALEGWCKAKRISQGAPQFAIVRPGPFESEFESPSPELVMGGLPFGKADRIVRRIDRGHKFVDVSDWHRVLANRLSSLIGPRALAIARRGHRPSS